MVAGEIAVAVVAGEVAVAGVGAAVVAVAGGLGMCIRRENRNPRHVHHRVFLEVVLGIHTPIWPRTPHLPLPDTISAHVRGIPIFPTGFPTDFHNRFPQQISPTDFPDKHFLKKSGSKTGKCVPGVF